MKVMRNSDDDDGGLDSLLDTMTNVVGILVLVLIVTQMSVADVVTRITSESKVDEEAMNEPVPDPIIRESGPGFLVDFDLEKIDPETAEQTAQTLRKIMKNLRRLQN